MTPLLEQFLYEAREGLQGISTRLLQLEDTPGDPDLINELFRLVHTLKGNSGLFDFPEMTRVLHAGEDLMSKVRSGKVLHSRAITDQLLVAMDFISDLCDDVEAEKTVGAERAMHSAILAQTLRALIPDTPAAIAPAPVADIGQISPLSPLSVLPEAVRVAAVRLAHVGETLYWISYTPAENCFFQGDDPFYFARQTPDCLWGCIVPREPWPPLPVLDAYRCVLDFHLLSSAPRALLNEHYRYIPDQVRIREVTPRDRLPAAEPAEEAPIQLPQTASGGCAEALDALFAAQRQILTLTDRPAWLSGRLSAVAQTLSQCCRSIGDTPSQSEIQRALEQALTAGDGAPLLAWLDARQDPARPAVLVSAQPDIPVESEAPAEEGAKFGRRADDAWTGPRTLKVDQVKIDRLMNLIGEMVVSKNALPYLAQRAEQQYGVRDLAREIKAQYAVINRIATEMQDAIMQVRMMPVSFVFQRFQRLVRDISHKLGKEVQLLLEGEDTEADKNIIESLADPLIHIVRNSLDHGLETPEVRRACGKPAIGTLTIRARQEADRVLIEIIDDGKGIDPAVIKQKAYENGIIDEATLERISDRDAINLVFAAGLSTAEVVSDLSGRGVGMDVVRVAVEKVNGSIVLESEPGRGTRIGISLPLSMAVTQVMIIEADRQLFGIPMEQVVETVRIAKSAIHTIKHCQTTVLRGRIVPLKTLNALLQLPDSPRTNADDEWAVLVARVGNAIVGLVVDDFREAMDVIQKPMAGVLANLSAYSGSALMGDGTVLMVLNLKEIV